MANSPAVGARDEELGAPNDQFDKERDLIQRYYQRFRVAETGTSRKKETWSILDIFDRGEQWKNANIPPWIPKPVTNYIRYVRTLKRANLAASIPQAHFNALDENYNQDVEDLQDAYEFVWHSEKVSRTLRRCVDRANLLGTSICYVYEDPTYIGGTYKGPNDKDNRMFKGKICVKQFPIYNFFPDPDAYRIANCKYIETTEILPLSQVKNLPAFKKFAGDKLKVLKGDQLDREDNADGTVLDRDNKPNQNLVHIHGDEMVTVHTHWERYFGDDGKWHLDVSYYTKNNYFFLLRIEDFKPGVYPFAIYYDEEEDQDFWGMSQAMDSLELQKTINKTAQTKSIIGTMHQNPQKVVSRSSGINAQELARTGTLPGKVWTTNDDPEKSIVNVTPPPIPRELFELEQGMKEDIKEMAGVNNAYTGTSVGSLTTSTGVNSLIDRASVRDRDKMIQIDDFVEDLSDIIAKYILHRWQDKRPIAVPQPNGLTRQKVYQPISKLTAENLEWLIRCDTYASAPVTQQQRSQDADSMMNLQGQFKFQPAIITPQEWIKMKNFPNTDDILQRMQKDADIMAKTQAQQTPKINTNGEVSFTLSSKDPTVVYTTLEDMMQQAHMQQQQDSALIANHVDNGLNTTPEQTAPSAPGQAPQGPQGDIGANAMAAMVKGR